MAVSEEEEESLLLLRVAAAPRSRRLLLLCACSAVGAAVGAAVFAGVWSPGSGSTILVRERAVVEDSEELFPKILNVTGLAVSALNKLYFRDGLDKSGQPKYLGFLRVQQQYAPSFTPELAFKDGHWEFFVLSASGGGEIRTTARAKCRGVQCLIRPTRLDFDCWTNDTDGNDDHFQMNASITVANVPERLHLGGPPEAVEKGLTGDYFLVNGGGSPECAWLQFQKPKPSTSVIRQQCGQFVSDGWEVSIHSQGVYSQGVYNISGYNSVSIPVGQLAWTRMSGLTKKTQIELTLRDPDAPDYLAFDGEWQFKACYIADPVKFTTDVGITLRGSSSMVPEEHFKRSGAKWQYGGSLKINGEASLGPKGSLTKFQVPDGSDSDKRAEKVVASTRSAAQSSTKRSQEGSYPKVHGQECFWQWRLPIKAVASGEMIFVNTRNLARTANKMMAPKCAPGCAADLSSTEGGQYQACVPSCV